MATVNSKADSYSFQSAYLVPEETGRLDGIHNAITEYLGALSLAPLDDLNPQNILEMGSGSGAWAIQAATVYPGARVLASDISPIPPRPLPPNLEFQKVDFTQPLPFEHEAFDVVHIRLVVMHLSHGADFLWRTFDLVKPGGWLLVEESGSVMLDGGGAPGPGMSAFHAAWLNVLRSRGADPAIGRDLERILGASGYFSTVHSRKVTIPLSEKSEDPAENRLGLAWKANLMRLAHELPTRLAALGVTEELALQFLVELMDPKRSITTDFYLTWSQRKITSPVVDR